MDFHSLTAFWRRDEQRHTAPALGGHGDPRHVSAGEDSLARARGLMDELVELVAELRDQQPPELQVSDLRQRASRRPRREGAGLARGELRAAFGAASDVADTLDERRGREGVAALFS